MGFDYIALPPPFLAGQAHNPFLPADLSAAHPVLCALAGQARSDRIAEVVESLCEICGDYQLRLIFDAVLDRADADRALVSSSADLFEDSSARILNPKSLHGVARVAPASFENSELLARFIGLWAAALGTLLSVGVAGFRFLNPACLTSNVWKLLTATLREAFPGMMALAYTPGTSWQAIRRLSGCGFDGAFSSLPWWDLQTAWFVEEFNLLRSIGHVITMPRAPNIRQGRNADCVEAIKSKMEIAAAIGDSLFIPAGAGTFAAGKSDPNADAVCAAVEQFARIQALGTCGPLHALNSEGKAIRAFRRHITGQAGRTETALITLVNSNSRRCEEVEIASGFADSSGRMSYMQLERMGSSGEALSSLAPREVRVVKATRTRAVASLNEPAVSAASLKAALGQSRIVIAAVEPEVSDRKLPARATINERIDVSADIFTDGHPVIAAELRWHLDESDWQNVDLQPGHNDRWSVHFYPRHVGRCSFYIEAWIDEFAGLLRDMKLKRDAGVDFTNELAEAKEYVERAAAAPEPALRAKLATLLNRLTQASAEEAISLLGEGHSQDAMRAAQPRRFLARSQPLFLEVERQKAAFAAWYELFPRSASADNRHGTFDDVIARLPDIRAMGFDVLYLPPIHPIGQTNRKGRNNSLKSDAGDPGSPYAIGAAAGGHDAIHEELGSFQDFERLIQAASEHGMEIALDFAVQCSPDHPWLKAHPEWFRWRADGSLRFAENPPKKYEDIVNVEFYPAQDATDLWLALRDIVAFWIEHGVKIFRVDNPHTKPLPFWQWLIADIRSSNPDVIFLSEAFTRPKMMYQLAKIGFSQSYTYFTWRNTKREITEYLTELTSPPVVNFFRPNFFVNTPDINPFFLQQSGRAGFLIRAVLAATLSGLWGIYSGFELCEAAALPGREEYLDSEKYEVKSRNFDMTGNIKREISSLNRIRQSNPALHTHRGLTFYNAFNDQIIAYGKALPARDEMIFVMVNLDPHNIQEATFEMPLWEWNLPDHESLSVKDLIRDTPPVIWNGKLQHVRLDPSILPYAIWRFAPIGRSAA